MEGLRAGQSVVAFFAPLKETVKHRSECDAMGPYATCEEAVSKTTNDRMITKTLEKVHEAQIVELGQHPHGGLKLDLILIEARQRFGHVHVLDIGD